MLFDVLRESGFIFLSRGKWTQLLWSDEIQTLLLDIRMVIQCQRRLGTAIN